MKVELVKEPTAEDRAAIAAPLIAFNQASGPPPQSVPLVVLLKDDGGQPVGGLWGKTVYDWLYVELLAVPESARGKGAGAALMELAERIAVERGCVGRGSIPSPFRRARSTRSWATRSSANSPIIQRAVHGISS